MSTRECRQQGGLDGGIETDGQSRTLIQAYFWRKHGDPVWGRYSRERIVENVRVIFVDGYFTIDLEWPDGARATVYRRSGALTEDECIRAYHAARDVGDRELRAGES